MNGVCLRILCLRILCVDSSSELSLTLDRKVDVELFISERTHELDALRF
jgi:hypothetical protein